MRVIFQKVKNFQILKEIIEQCYEADGDLCEKYHAIAPDTKRNCITHTLNYAINSGKVSRIEFWELKIQNNFVGYFGQQIFAEKNYFLFGFFIMPEWRTPEFKQKFWRIVKSKFPNKIDCMLYSKNTRASKFLKSSGFKCVRKDMIYDGKAAEQWMTT